VTSPQSGKPRKWPPDTCGIAFEKLVDRCQLQSSTPAIRHPNPTPFIIPTFKRISRSFRCG